MQSAAAQGGTVGVLTRLLNGGLNFTTIFSGGLLGLLAVIVGVPVAMVALMGLRTGFPGEGGPLTLANFISVYADRSTYEVLVNTVLFATGTVAVTLLFA